MVLKHGVFCRCLQTESIQLSLSLSFVQSCTLSLLRPLAVRVRLCSVLRHFNAEDSRRIGHFLFTITGKYEDLAATTAAVKVPLMSAIEWRSLALPRNLQRWSRVAAMRQLAIVRTLGRWSSNCTPNVAGRMKVYGINVINGWMDG